MLGVVLCPAVLGQWAPHVYQRLFVGGTEPTAQLEGLEHKIKELSERYPAPGEADVAFTEQLAQYSTERDDVQMQMFMQRAQHAQWLTGMMMALLLASIAIMAAESLVGPRPDRAGAVVVPQLLGKLITIRYSLVALLISLALAQPIMLRQTPIVFAGLLIVVALVAALIPLGPKHSDPAA